MPETKAEQLRFIKDTHRRRVRLSTNAIDFLLEQAERAQKLSELEETKFRLYNNGFEEERWALQEENIRLREAIKQSLEKHKWNNEE